MCFVPALLGKAIGGRTGSIIGGALGGGVPGALVGSMLAPKKKNSGAPVSAPMTYGS